METDSTLLDAARMMNHDALVKIFDLYATALFKYVLRLCGDPMLADHIVGDVFVKVIEQFSSGTGPASNLRSYLYETAYHRLIDEVRGSRRKAPLEAASLLQQDTPSANLAWEEHILMKQVLYAVQHRLTADQRHVIVLRFLEGFSLRETATIMGKKESHIKVIQGRAVAAIRKALDQKGSTPPKKRNPPKTLGI